MRKRAIMSRAKLIAFFSSIPKCAFLTRNPVTILGDLLTDAVQISDAGRRNPVGA
jgi:hypothetical protein